MAVNNHHDEHHVVPVHVYIAVFLSLIALTWVTAWISTIDLGPFNIYVALSIAVFKASLVVLFFMHVKYSSKLTKMVIGCGIFWLMMLLFIVMADIWTRGWMGVPGR
jgi:cytochrome c oxidase subunit 4